ncbi:MAG: glycosyltransferase, partial [Syntrophothermus sp.]
SRDYEVITNGFDPDDFRHEEVTLDERFSLTHVGSLNKDRNPEFLWRVISRICKEREDFRKDLCLRFIGKNDISLTLYLEKYNLLQNTELISYMPHEQVLKESARSRVLLLLLNNTPNVKSIVSGKLFEYLAARRPILAVGPVFGDAARIIGDAGAGKICDFEDETAARKAILELYQEYKNQDKGQPEGNIDSYSRKALTGKIATLLDEISHA